MILHKHLTFPPFRDPWPPLGKFEYLDPCTDFLGSVQ